MSEASEVNVFSIDPRGYKSHFKIVAGTTGEELNEVLKRQQQLTEWLAANDFRPDTMGRGPAPAPAEPDLPFEDGEPRTKRDGGTRRLAAPPCGECGGEVWDNRNNKKNPKGPDFTCRDKDECRTVGWIDKEGGVTWKESNR